VVAFHFDVRSFADDDYVPKAVWVEDTGDRCYTKRFGGKRRKELRALLKRVQERDEQSAASARRQRPLKR
jgi:hypothetical protein